MTKWEPSIDETIMYELSWWFDDKGFDEDDKINGVHIDDAQDSLYGLIHLLCMIDVLEYVDISEGEPTIWLKQRYGK